jgi:hypothetical protein
MKKLIYSYEDELQNVEEFKKLGFKCELDDNSFYCSIDLSEFDLLNVLSIVEDCISLNLKPIVEIDNKTYFINEDYNEIEDLISKDPLKI